MSCHRAGAQASLIRWLRSNLPSTCMDWCVDLLISTKHKKKRLYACKSFHNFIVAFRSSTCFSTHELMRVLFNFHQITKQSQKPATTRVSFATSWHSSQTYSSNSNWGAKYLIFTKLNKIKTRYGATTSWHSSYRTKDYPLRARMDPRTFQFSRNKTKSQPTTPCM